METDDVPAELKGVLLKALNHCSPDLLAKWISWLGAVGADSEDAAAVETVVERATALSFVKSTDSVETDKLADQAYLIVQACSALLKKQARAKKSKKSKRRARVEGAEKKKKKKSKTSYSGSKKRCRSDQSSPIDLEPPIKQACIDTDRVLPADAATELLPTPTANETSHIDMLVSKTSPDIAKVYIDRPVEEENKTESGEQVKEKDQNQNQASTIVPNQLVENCESSATNNLVDSVQKEQTCSLREAEESGLQPEPTNIAEATNEYAVSVTIEDQSLSAGESKTQSPALVKTTSLEEKALPKIALPAGLQALADEAIIQRQTPVKQETEYRGSPPGNSLPTNPVNGGTFLKPPPQATPHLQTQTMVPAGYQYPYFGGVMPPGVWPQGLMPAGIPTGSANYGPFYSPAPIGNQNYGTGIYPQTPPALIEKRTINFGPQNVEYRGASSGSPLRVGVANSPVTVSPPSCLNHSAANYLSQSRYLYAQAARDYEALQQSKQEPLKRYIPGQGTQNSKRQDKSGANGHATQCSGRTKAGKPCKRVPPAGFRNCPRHQRSHSSK